MGAVARPDISKFPYDITYGDRLELVKSKYYSRLKMLFHPVFPSFPREYTLPSLHIDMPYSIIFFF